MVDARTAWLWNQSNSNWINAVFPLATDWCYRLWNQVFAGFHLASKFTCAENTLEICHKIHYAERYAIDYWTTGSQMRSITGVCLISAAIVIAHWTNNEGSGCSPPTGHKGTHYNVYMCVLLLRDARADWCCRSGVWPWSIWRQLWWCWSRWPWTRKAVTMHVNYGTHLRQEGSANIPTSNVVSIKNGSSDDAWEIDKSLLTKWINRHVQLIWFGFQCVFWEFNSGCLAFSYKHSLISTEQLDFTWKITDFI